LDEKPDEKFTGDNEVKAEGSCKKYYKWVIGAINVFWMMVVIVILVLNSSIKDLPNKIKLD
jgi:hypothetical protein